MQAKSALYLHRSFWTLLLLLLCFVALYSCKVRQHSRKKGRAAHGVCEAYLDISTASSHLQSMHQQHRDSALANAFSQ